MDIQGFWDAVLKQDARKIEKYFWDDAYINWHCTNEHFNVKEYIKANCEYPGDWEGKIQRVEQAGDVSIVVVHVYNQDKSLSFQVVSFLRIRDDKICSVDEYWGDDGAAPDWRLEMQIGTAILE